MVGLLGFITFLTALLRAVPHFCGAGALCANLSYSYMSMLNIFWRWATGGELDVWLLYVSQTPARMRRAIRRT